MYVSSLAVPLYNATENGWYSRNDACRSKFIKYDGVRALSVTGITRHSTVASCQRWCLKNDDCVGIDFTKSRECYYVTDTRDLQADANTDTIY